MPYQRKTSTPLDKHDDQLQSTFALNLLTQIANQLEPTDFSQEMSSVFGDDIPAHTYLALRDHLLAGRIENPPILTTRGSGYVADYDNRQRVIRIDAHLLSRVLSGSDHWQLLSVLLHEFGHHIDNILRHDLSDRHPDGSLTLAPDARQEEGERFACWIAMLGQFATDRVEVAQYRYQPCSQVVDIQVCWEQASRMIIEHFNDGQGMRPYPPHQHPDREAFEAGAGDSHGHTHQTIEWVLKEFNFTRDEIDAVYFGNWLRDYSQVIDPKITRAPDMPKDFPALISRDAWTQLVDVLAVKKFPDLRMRSPDDMKVTTEKLGVYRPSEHIDNPVVSNPAFPDPRVRDPDFEPWVLQGDPLTEVDPETSIKRYIARSVTYMQQELGQAMSKGRTLDGLRSCGAAMHVLEDLFAHSNFAELSLIKAGHVAVLPWTTPVPCKWQVPLVTGTFGATDIIASLAAPLGKLMFSTAELEFELTQPGYRSDRDQVMLILLQEYPDPRYLQAFNLFLQARDELSTLAKTLGIDILTFYRWLANTPVAILLNAYNVIAQGLLTWIGNSVDDAQTLTGSDPNSNPAIDATHSQLSKDHAEHPLHDLAALLATEAVRRVAQALVEHWDGKPGADDPLALAGAFFCHPMDSTWQDEIVTQWAAQNEAQIARSESKTELDKTQENMIQELRKAHSQLVGDSTQFLDYLFNSTDKQPTDFGWLVEQGFELLLSKNETWKALQDLANPAA